MKTKNNMWQRKNVMTEESDVILQHDYKGLTIATGRDFEYKTCGNQFKIVEQLPSRILALDPRPKQDVFNIIYPKNYEPYNFNKLPSIVKKARNAVQYLKVRAIKKVANKGARILDIGCGNGDLLGLLKSQNSMNWELYANEINKECISHLEKNGIHVIDQKVENIDIVEMFDVIILNQVLEHFSNTSEVLDKCYSLLKPQGVLFIETPSTSGLDFNLFYKKYWGGYHFPRHFYLFNHKNIREVILGARFSEVSCKYLASPAFWIQSFHHLLADKGLRKMSHLFTIKNPILLMLFTFIDLTMISLGLKTSNMRVVCFKK